MPVPHPERANSGTVAGAERHAPVSEGLNRDSADWGIMLRSLMAIWGLSATFFLLLLLFGDPPGDTRTVLLGVDAIAFTVLGMLLVGQERLPRWTPDVCAYVMYVIVGAVIFTVHRADSPIAFFYLWLSVHSFYFLPWRRAAPQVAFIAVNYAVSLPALPGAAFPLLRWGVTVLTVIVICTLVALLRARVDALVARLSGVARTDPLTGLRNRRAYDEQLAVEIARADRTGRPLALLVIDIDHFKRVNDRYGHPAGDSVLRKVAAELERTARQVDVVARIGGEEFVILLPDTDRDGGYAAGERMRFAVRHAFGRDRFRVSISVGVAAYPDNASDADAVFQAADIALLAGKDAGRDTTVVYSGRRLRTVPETDINGPAARRRSAEDTTPA